MPAKPDDLVLARLVRAADVDRDDEVGEQATDTWLLSTTPPSMQVRPPRGRGEEGQGYARRRPAPAKSVEPGGLPHARAAVTSTVFTSSPFAERVEGSPGSRWQRARSGCSSRSRRRGCGPSDPEVVEPEEVALRSASLEAASRRPHAEECPGDHRADAGPVVRGDDPRSSSARRTPMRANPSSPPPPRTRAMRLPTDVPTDI